jgi:hypothetical protein
MFASVPGEESGWLTNSLANDPLDGGAVLAVAAGGGCCDATGVEWVGVGGLGDGRKSHGGGSASSGASGTFKC